MARKKLLSVILIVVINGLVFNITLAQKHDQGIGLRVGDPLGVTYKSYFDSKAALELVLGTTSGNRHGTYYKRTFNNKDKYNGFNYVDHTIGYTLALQARLLIHEKFPANVEGRLDWYWGLGGQMRISEVDYSYIDANSIIWRDSYTNIDLGPEGILGLEYELLDYPLVCFSEVSLFTELIDNPFRFRFFGAIGVRYAF